MYRLRACADLSPLVGAVVILRAAIAPTTGGGGQTLASDTHNDSEVGKTLFSRNPGGPPPRPGRAADRPSPMPQIGLLLS